MASLFASQFAASAVPGLMDQFGEIITLHLDRDATIRAIVSIDPVTEEEGGPITVAGSFSVVTQEVKRLYFSSGQLMEVTIGGRKYDAIEDGRDDENGMTRFTIRRKYTDAKYTNLNDLHGNQIPFAE